MHVIRLNGAFLSRNSTCQLCISYLFLSHLLVISSHIFHLDHDILHLDRLQAMISHWQRQSKLQGKFHTPETW